MTVSKTTFGWSFFWLINNHMTVFNRNPQNTNPLQPTKFTLTFSKLPAVTYFCQQVNLPGVSMGEVVRPTPFLDQYLPGTKMEYNPLSITFILDEELAGWKNMYDWFTSMADPDGFEPRGEVGRVSGKNTALSDATLTVLNNLNNPVLRINFKNVFPLSMSDIDFDTTSSADTIMTNSVTFRYESYKYLTV